MTIGECLREARGYRGLSQSELLRKMSPESTTWLARISGHETGKSIPTMQVLERYCDALNIVISYRTDRKWSWRPGE